MHKLFLSLFLALLTSTGFQCQPTKLSSSLTGKLVITGPCNHYIVQVLEGSYTPSQVDTSWTDTLHKSVYKNVFAVANECDFAMNGLAAGTIFSFEWEPAMSAQTCVECLAASPAPSKLNAVRNVRKIK